MLLFSFYEVRFGAHFEVLFDHACFAFVCIKLRRKDINYFSKKQKTLADMVSNRISRICQSNSNPNATVNICVLFIKQNYYFLLTYMICYRARNF
jgi:hypothetical protein